MISFENNKSPGNDGLTKGATYWDDIRHIYEIVKRIKIAKKDLCTSQPQAIVKLHEKPIKDK